MLFQHVRNAFALSLSPSLSLSLSLSFFSLSLSLSLSLYLFFFTFSLSLSLSLVISSSLSVLVAAMMSGGVFKYSVEGFLVPLISLFGFLGNLLTILVLNHREVKLKQSLVRVLCGLANFDNVFLVCACFLFTLPALSER
jgi:hypothetical protein